jgi:GNAT superfamily N-acetyltransferase
MAGLPAPGTRVAIRYRRPGGSVPSMTDVVGHLVRVEPMLSVRTRAGDVVDIATADVVSMRVVPEIPVRNPDIRRLEHAAAMAWPGLEQHWLDGWLLRSGCGYTHRANSAVPLEFSATLDAAPAIIDWYAQRGLPPLLAVPERLLRLPADTPIERPTVVLARDVSAGAPDPTVTLASRPDDEWLALYRRDIPVEVLTAVVGGEAVFGSRACAAVGRAAVTDAPDGTRWVGLSAVHVTEDQRGRGHARALCSALLSWGAEHGATRAYVQVLTDNGAAISLYESMDFVLHHRCRYVNVESFGGRRV